ncbi:triacylglycerol lipase precursor [Yamadazyma tenuis ATCC 10573]|uniref:triacylglycerol lipase n=1 Tax=Candida tenuis (strain ATCC 10573 / BCRC 21748 / CBS 615 / JCM 9827 / NBRC 10315 / NRRL Y-1498 / VKM Y-70) TaxID=590646 RepID=G3BC96_CANTC|nr:triacylglycerol lipase precursor [Yamadazyma tenuis ATCC 10573]EGV60148.1 triacylglycerol lipase precursor [Yamadazyma tenuis ATCC 10573]
MFFLVFSILSLPLVVANNVWSPVSNHTTPVANIPILPVPEDYKKLVEFANIVSFSYCTQFGLQAGKLGEEDSHCPGVRCKYPEFSNIEVLRTFDFNTLKSVGSGFYGVDYQKKRIILAFRGSSTKRDWFANLDFIQKPYQPLFNLLDKKKAAEKVDCNGCMVHRGFYNFVEEHCKTVIAAVSELKQQLEDYELVVLGHSLGGAFALLSGIEFQLLGYNPLVVTFASPRVGNKKMMRYVDKIFNSEKIQILSQKQKQMSKGFIRVVHKHDIVPMLPPSRISYVHGGVEYLITSTKLPHLPKDIQRVGVYNYDDSKSVSADLDKILRIIPEIFTNFEHVHYFVKISGCN